MRIILTCGGTAGHINPALAIAGRLREIDAGASVLFIGAHGNMETELVPRSGFEIKTVSITNLKRGFGGKELAHNMRTVKNIFVSISQAKKIIKEFQPDVVIGTGGYVCYPVIKAASDLGIPSAVHESNAVPGLTTKALEGKVQKILVGFDESKVHYKRKEKLELTGTPVRGEFFLEAAPNAKKKLGFSEKLPLVVSVWGSLGSTKMNELMLGIMERASKRLSFSLVHSVGKRDYEALVNKVGSEKLKELMAAGIDIREYIYDMPKLFSAADLILCRAGASTLSELAAAGKPSVLIPSPNVTNNHQEKNARVFAEKGAAELLLENDAKVESLLGLISELLRNKERLESMSQQARLLSVPDATDRIISVVLGLCEMKASADYKS